VNQASLLHRALTVRSLSILLGLAAIVGAMALALPRLPGPDGSTDCEHHPFAIAEVPGRPRLWIDVAATPEQWAVGLMDRTSLAADHGLAFIFGDPMPAWFWGHQTYIPLSVAWVDARGSVLDIQDLRPMSDEIHDAAAPASAAIEANQGWFQRNGVTSGTHVDLCLG
jgi:uncharacterized membrane protein (UPF0127 family)